LVPAVSRATGNGAPHEVARWAPPVGPAASPYGNGGNGGNGDTPLSLEDVPPAATPPGNGKNGGEVTDAGAPIADASGGGNGTPPKVKPPKAKDASKVKKTGADVPAAESNGKSGNGKKAKG